MNEYLYVLRLVERLHKKDNWTEDDNEIISEHFNYLVNLKKNGQLILAGKTQESDKDTFGLVIFRANNFSEAEKIASDDPAVVKKIMTSQLYNYKVALSE